MVAELRVAGLRVWLRPALAAVLLGLTLWILRRELQAIHYRDARQALAALPAGHVLLALMFVAANYLALTCYDQLAFAYIGKRIARWHIPATAFVGYAVSNSIGFALLSGTAVRHRFYSRWGVGTADLSRIVVFNSTAYWLGLLVLAGWSCAFHPHAYLQGRIALRGAQGLGIAFMAMAGGYLLLAGTGAGAISVDARLGLGTARPSLA